MAPWLSKAGQEPGDRKNDATAAFHDALLRARHRREALGEVEAAAARYCRELREQGVSPEHTLKDAKQVIHDAIDGEDAMTAERAVQSCIRHYYRDD
jgi:DNA-binding FadR family transcriptional regulator